MSQTTTIAIYQPLLQSIAYRMVGCIQDAEDIVQDTFLKFLSTDVSKIENIKAYLVKSVTNNCLNHINSIKERKKEYLDSVKIPELFERLDFAHLDIRQELSAALNILHNKLAPLEQGLFLLREVFDFDYDELQKIFNKKKDHCRQLVCRAKEKLTRDTEIFSFDVDKYFDAIDKASKEGDFDALMDYIFQTGPSD